MQHAIKINFDCVLADEKRSKSIGKSKEDYICKMEEIKKEFDDHCEDLKKDKSLYAYFCYQYGRLRHKNGKEADQAFKKAETYYRDTC